MFLIENKEVERKEVEKDKKRLEKIQRTFAETEKE